jgi:hypothetical protein
MAVGERPAEPRRRLRDGVRRSDADRLEAFFARQFLDERAPPLGRQKSRFG